MSHRQERKEKDCLNCGTIVQGRYCHHCGQENVLAKESFGHLAKHFIYDITHFDSKFFDSVRYLLFRPGFLPKEYMLGRRTRYLNPIKMYVFTSAVFFILFFSFFKTEKAVVTGIDQPLTAAERQTETRKGEEAIRKKSGDQGWNEALPLLKDSTRPVTWNQLYATRPYTFYIPVNGRHYYSYRQYDSLQKSLPAANRDGFFVKLYAKKLLGFFDKNRHNLDGAFKNFLSGVLHRLPYLLFFSLPLFALILKLLYSRRKEFYYEDHAVFSIYHYIFSFFLLLLLLITSRLGEWTHYGIFDTLTAILFFLGGFYLYKSMRRFYRQGRGKTILKFILLNIAGFTALGILFVLFIAFSFFEL